MTKLSAVIILLEAFAAGVPAVATAVGGIPEVLVDGACGYLVPPNDVESLVERIGDLLNDAERRRTMGGAAGERVVRHFSTRQQG